MPDQLIDRSRDEGVHRLSELMRRVSSSTDTSEVLEEIARGVTEGLGYGIAAISRLEGDVMVTTTFSGPEEERQFVIGRRRSVKLILDEYEQGDRWGILRYIPHGRVSEQFLEGMWIPDYVPPDLPDAWHPEDALYAPLYSATGELLGNMAVDLPPGGRVPEQQERELLEMFVVQAGLALSNAQQRARLAEQVRLGEMLKEVALASNRVDLDLVLAESVRALHRGTGATQVWIRCFSEGSGAATEHAVGHPVPAGEQQSVPGLRADLDDLVRHQRFEPLVHVLTDPPDAATTDSLHRLLPRSAEPLLERAAGLGPGTAVLTPLRVGVEVLGYAVVLRGAEHETFTRAEVEACADVGRELGRMVLNARLRSTEQRLVEELQEVDRYKGELIATISHELKTPLTSIVGHTELLEEGGALERSVPAIARNARRLQGLVDNLLSYSKVQQKRARTTEPVDVRDLVESSLDVLGVQAERAQVVLALEAPAGKALAQGDPEELRRVVDNICSNAVKYSPSGGEVRAVVTVDDQWVTLSVSDQGLGISQQDQGHLFSAFHRSSNPVALSIPGTGLGLAISRRIVEQHGGDVTVDSELGRGSTFTVRLPRPAPPPA